MFFPHPGCSCPSTTDLLTAALNGAELDESCTVHGGPERDLADEARTAALESLIAEERAKTVQAKRDAEPTPPTLAEVIALEFRKAVPASDARSHTPLGGDGINALLRDAGFTPEPPTAA